MFAVLGCQGFRIFQPFGVLGPQVSGFPLSWASVLQRFERFVGLGVSGVFAVVCLLRFQSFVVVFWVFAALGVS